MDDLSNKKIERYNKTILSLESLVRLVTTSKADSSISVTLNLHGTLVSGELVSVANYHKFLNCCLDNGLMQMLCYKFSLSKECKKCFLTLDVKEDNDNHCVIF